MPRTLPPLKGNEKVWRDLLPVGEHLQQHGRHVYMFRNSQTNQILYTLHPRIEQRTLQQLPFIGKHSVPARIRPDLWKAHCRVGPFQHPKQGLDAIKKLRELRKLHELCWDKTNPEWRKNTKKKLIRLIMDQRKNAAADLAKVLSIQEQVALSMKKARKDRKQEQEEFLDKKWREYEDMAHSVEQGKVTQLETRCDEARAELESGTLGPEDKRRLETEINKNKQEIRKLLNAHRMVEKLNAAQEPIQAAFDRETTKRAKKLVYFERMGQKENLEKVKNSPEPKMGKNPVREALLTKFLKPKPAHFSVRRIECQWADMLDAEYATGSWPASVIHQPLIGGLGTIKVQTADERFESLREMHEKVNAETDRIAAEMKLQAENDRREAEGLPPLKPEPEAAPESEPEVKTGLAKYTGWIRNPFKRSSA